MGLLSNLIAGGASAGANLYAQKSIEDQRREAELEKLARIDELNQQATVRAKKAAADEGMAVETGAAKRDKDWQTKQVLDSYREAGNTEATENEVDDDQRKLYQPSRSVSAQSRLDESTRLGLMGQAAIHEKTLENARKEERDAKTDDYNRERNAVNDRKVDATIARDTGNLEMKAQSLALQQQLLDLKGQLLSVQSAKSDNKDLPATSKILIDGWNRRIAELEKESMNPMISMKPDAVSAIKERMDALQENIMKEVGRSTKGEGLAPLSPPKPESIVIDKNGKKDFTALFGKKG